MKYMLLIYSPENCYTDAERRECMVESMGVCEQLSARGKFLDAAPLQFVATAKTLRVRDGRPLITAGPFAETVEQLGGFYLLDLDDLDEAIAVASKLPPVRKGTVEVRPVRDRDGLPPARPHAVEGGTAPYLLLCHHNEAEWAVVDPAVREKTMEESVALARELSDAGAYYSAAPLHPSSAATCVRIRDGKRTITDGPFDETHEVLGGYYLIRAESQDDALRVAARFPGARRGSVEVRQLFDLSAVREPATIS